MWTMQAVASQGKWIFGLFGYWTHFVITNTLKLIFLNNLFAMLSIVLFISNFDAYLI